MDTRGENAARAYNAGLGARGRAPGQGPGEAEKLFSFWMSNGSSKFASFYTSKRKEATGESSSKPDPPLPSPVKTPDLHQSQEKSLAKVGWTWSRGLLLRGLLSGDFCAEGLMSDTHSDQPAVGLNPKIV